MKNISSDFHPIFVTVVINFVVLALPTSIQLISRCILELLRWWALEKGNPATIMIADLVTSWLAVLCTERIQLLLRVTIALSGSEPRNPTP